jgi:hypothetical protein
MEAAVDIRPTYMALAFMSEAAPIRAHVGGFGPFQLRWKQVTRIPVAPGDVMIVIWSSWVTKKFMGTSHAVVPLGPGEVIGIEWKPPQTVFGTGKLKVADVGPPTRFGELTQADIPDDPGPRAVSGRQPVRQIADVPLQQAAMPAGTWHPDPTGRYAHRWWDGARWTDTVSDGSRTYSDPVAGL